MRIAIDAGHGGHDPGATFHGVFEKNICLEVAGLLATRMEDAGADVLLTRSADVFVPISERAQIANAFKADVFVCLHMNADADEDLPGMHEARGAEIWVYPGSQAGHLLAGLIEREIRIAFPDEPFRGVKEEEFGVLAVTQMPAVLIEMAFIDNSESVRRMSDPFVQEEFAAAIAEGVLQYEKNIKP